MLASAHRGRLNILAELLEYPHTALFHKIKGNCEFPADLEVSGDAISHFGKLSDSTEHLFSKNLTNGKTLVASPYLSYEGSSEPIKVSLLPNPSHLGMFVRSG